MSLYNMLFGMNPGSDFFLAMLNLQRGDVGRFRDCYLRRGPREAETVIETEPLYIVVYTRNGGGNREDYEAVTETLQAHPNYVTDYDDDFDCTYASYEFLVPEAFKAPMEEFVRATPESLPEATPQERFQTLIAKLQDDSASDDPAVKNAVQIGQTLLAAISKVPA